MAKAKSKVEDKEPVLNLFDVQLHIDTDLMSPNLQDVLPPILTTEETVAIKATKAF